MKVFLATIVDEEQGQTHHEEVVAFSKDEAYEDVNSRWPGAWIHEVNEINCNQLQKILAF